LTHWTPEAASTLNAMVARHADKGAFAVFDMDNTLYRYDLEESLLPFLFHGTDVENGGVRVWVDRREKYLKQITGMQEASAARQKELGLPVSADKNWVVVKPEVIQ
jgi:hypothetical protein